jgi:hypothetical protein
LFRIEQGLRVSGEDDNLVNLIAGQKSLLAGAFGVSPRHHSKKSRRLQEANLQILKTLGCFQEWMEETGPSILLLSGRNFDDYEAGRDLCWLSPVAAELAEYLQDSKGEDQKRCTLFYPVQKVHQRRSTIRASETLDKCLSNLILQILSWDTLLVNTEREFIESTMKDEKWKTDSTGEKKKILTRLLDACQCLDQVVLIIDRLDCMAKALGSVYEQRDIPVVLRYILDLAAGTTCKMKLLIIIDSTYWGEVSSDEDASEKWTSGAWRDLCKLDRFNFHYKIDWHQEKIEDEDENDP